MAKKSTKKEKVESAPKPTKAKVSPIDVKIFYNSDSEGNISSLKDISVIRKEVAEYLEKGPSDSVTADSFMVLYNLLLNVFNAYETTNEKSKETTKVVNFLLKQISNLKEVSDLSIKSLK